RVLSGAPGPLVFILAQQGGQFLVLGSPSIISMIESLGQPTPAHIPDQCGLFIGSRAAAFLVQHLQQL
ncbi:hypothetical protein DB390_33165, partial [Pseudomonas aeruginosa]